LHVIANKMVTFWPISTSAINLQHTILTYNLFNPYPTLKNYRIHGSWIKWQLMDMAHFVHSVGLIWANNHMWTRDIDMVWPMRFIIYLKKIVGVMFSQTKHLFTLKMRNSCREWKLKSIIGNDYHKFGSIL